jgi:hypothetical protein
VLVPSASKVVRKVKLGVVLTCVGPGEGGRSERLLASLAIEV